jgi:hypothetical protein
MSDTLTATQVGKKIRLVWTYTPAPSWPDASGYIYNEGEHGDMWVEGYSSSSSNTFTRHDDYLHLYAVFNNEIAAVTDKKVDLTNISYVKMQFQYYDNDVYYDRMAELDVSNLSGEWYIRFHIFVDANWSSLYAYFIASDVKDARYNVYDVRSVDLITTFISEGDVKIKKVWLE